MMGKDEIIVGMGYYAIAYEGTVIATIGLGSCVGVVVYDPEAKITGMAHVMLPDSKESRIGFLDKKALLSIVADEVHGSIKSVLEKNEFNIVGEAKQKDETLNVLKSAMPSVSYIDINLPPNGEDALTEIKTNFPDSNVVMVSNSLDKSKINQLLRAGAEDVIVSPFTESKIMDVSDYIIRKNLMRFADISIPKMIDSMISRGCKIERMKAKIVGGGHMFADLNDSMNIGKRNTEAVKKILQEKGIPIEYEETGGSIGRTIRFNTSELKLRIKTKDGEKEV